MSSQVCRVQGFSKGSLSSIGNEAERGNVNHRNPDIDKSQSINNVAFKESPHGFYAEWNDIKTSLNAQFNERKGAVAFEGMVITAERKFFEDTFGWEQGKPMSPAMEQYFKDSYKWALEYVGYKGTDRNVLSAVVHLDETTPHLQMYYLPVTEKWREKVYAKGEDGKVLRTERGTPIQAKDEKGKTLFRDVEDQNAPKLARTEFWQQRGGQSSYREMQDSYQEQVGRKYGLDRGEVGSDRKHKTKAQHEYEQLENRLEPLRKDAAAIDQVEAVGKRIPFSKKVVLDRGELEQLKEQAVSYTTQAKGIKKRSEELDNRSKELDARANALVGREIRTRDDWANLEREEAALRKRKAEFERQMKEYAPRLAAVAEREREVEHLRDLPAKYREAVAENGRLREKVGELTAENKRLSERLSEAVEKVKETVQSFALFRYGFGRDEEYKTRLTPRQGVLFGCIIDRAENWLRNRGHEDAANEIRKYRPVSPELGKAVEAKWSQRESDSQAVLEFKERKESLRYSAEAKSQTMDLTKTREPRTQERTR